MESTPQLHLYLMLLAIHFEYIIDIAGEWYNFALFVAGLTSSVLSACLGMTRLLMDGPSKLVKKQGYLGGYLQVGFPLVIFSIMFVLVTKGLLTAESCTCTCKCGPYMKRSGLDIETLEIVDLGYHDLHSRLQTLVNSF